MKLTSISIFGIFLEFVSCIISQFSLAFEKVLYSSIMQKILKFIKIHFALLFLFAKIIGLVPFSLSIKINQFRVYRSRSAHFFVIFVRIIILFGLCNEILTLAEIRNVFVENTEMFLILTESIHHIINFAIIHLMQIYYTKDLIKLFNAGINLWISIRNFLSMDQVTFVNYILSEKLIKICKIQIILTIFHLFNLMFWFIWALTTIEVPMNHFFWFVILSTTFCICQFYVNGGIFVAWLYFYIINKKLKLLTLKKKPGTFQAQINHNLNQIFVLYLKSSKFLQQFFNVFKLQVLLVILLICWNMTKSVSLNCTK